jgi:CheY-like chemotaxis protein
MMMRILLEAKGYRIFEASDGHEAIKLARRKHPHVLLLDLQLPGMNGLEVTRHLRRDQTLQFLRIVIVSGEDLATHREIALAAGCHDYLSKPIDFDLLDEILKREGALDSVY